MTSRILILVLMALGSWGCAEGSVDAPAGDMGTDTPVNNVNNLNSLNNVNNANNTNNTNNDCSTCCAGDKVCTDVTTVGICRADGREFNDAPCLNDQVCEDGICIDPPECVGGERSCFDQDTVLVCRQSGDGYVSSPCEADTSCFLGTCESGDPLGTACTTDEGCITGNCHCGSGTDEACPGSIAQGYCASSTCDSTSCGRDGLCVASAVIPLGVPSADYNHCVPRCTIDCAAGFECIDLPVATDTGVVWEKGCYFSGFAGIGGECTNDAQCIGGECLTDVFNTKYCSRTCTDDGECPEGAACVNLKSDGQFYCSLLCGDGGVLGTTPCSLDMPTDRFDVTCKRLSTVSGGVSRVCAGSN